MDTSQAKIPKSPGDSRAPTHSWPGQALAARPSANLPPTPFRLTAEESARFLRIISEGSLINRHYGIYRWLNGEMQKFLPHEILISAWGDFAKRRLKLDVTSGLPGVRTRQLAHCRVDDLIRLAYEQWVDAGRQPVLLETAEIMPPRACGCPIHAALRSMRAALVHGVRDDRGGHESLYVAFSRERPGQASRSDSFRFLVDWLITQIDVAFRKVAAYPLEGTEPPEASGVNWLDLSRREGEILDRMCRGETNINIAVALDISPYTVKNHVQRIFRKIGVNNRTQAAAKYNQALRASGEPA